MLDGVSLDQLRTFVAAVDEGSFSAAARKLRRAQSVVSQTIGNLEAQLRLMLFDRSLRFPRLTAEGAVLLADARTIIDRVDAMKARAKGISGGLEAELSVAIDVMFPIGAVTQVAHQFAKAFPATPLRLSINVLGGVALRVMDGQCCLGIIGTLPDVPSNLRSERLLAMQMVMVASAEHPLALIDGTISRVDLAPHTQMVLTDDTTLSAGRDFGVLSPNTWKLSDLSAKHAFLLAGLGWGAMPITTVENDIVVGRLKILAIEDEPPAGRMLPMSVVYQASAPPGPAGRWFIETVKGCATAHEARSRLASKP